MAVQLPDFSSLGVVNPQPATAQPVYPQTSAVAEGEGKLGQGIEKAGGTIEDVAAYSQMARNRMDRAMADADFTGRIIPLTEQLKTETDPEKLTQLRGQFQDAIETAGQAIGDPAARQLWQAQQSKHVAAGQAEADLRNTQVYRDRYKAGVIGQATELSRTGAVASDPTAFALARDNIGHLMQSAQDAGALTAVEAENYGKAATKQLVEGRALNLVNGGNPAAAKAFLEQHAADLDPITSQNLQIRLEGKASGALGDSMLRDATGRGGSAPVSGDLADRIVGAESGGNPNAKNPLSSASGPGQFIDSTWLSMVKSQAPDVAAGKSDAQILALKNDPALARQMTGAYAQQNAAQLAAQGLPTDDGALYLAHFLGPGGAAKVLSADPSTPMAQIVGPDVLKANPQIAGVTAGDVRQLTAARVGAVPIPTGAQPAQPAGPPAPGMADLAAAEQELAQRHARTVEALTSDPRGADNPTALQHALQKADTEFRARQLAISAQKQSITESRNAAADGYVQNMMKGPIDPGIVQQIAADPKLDTQTRENLWALYSAHTKNGVEGDTAKYGPKFFEYFQRIAAPEDDPNKLRDPSQIYALAVPKPDGSQDLTLAGADKLRGELQSSQRDPNGASFARRLSEFWQGTKPQIDKSGLLPGLPNDGRGQERFYQFQSAVYAKIAQQVKAGKDPNDLIDPSKPDYMGKDEALKPYKRSMTQALADFQSEMSGGAADESKPPVSAVEITATGPNGQKAALRGGQWVDVQTGKPIGGEPQPQAPIR